MGTPDPAILEDLLQRHLDEDLSTYERRQLDQHLRASREFQREKERLEGVVALLEEARIPVDAGFRQRVLSSLPAAGWEARSARAWRLPVAIFAALAVVGTVLAKAAQPAVGSLAAAFSGAIELWMTAALTGFGLLGASWKGLQIAFRGLGAGSPWAMVGLVAVVLGLNVLLVFALRQRPRLAPARKDREPPSNES